MNGITEAHIVWRAYEVFEKSTLSNEFTKAFLQEKHSYVGGVLKYGTLN